MKNTMKECYMDARVRLHKTNEEIAKAYGRKKATIDRAIGSDKKFFKELYEKEHKKMEENKFGFEDEVEESTMPAHDSGDLVRKCKVCGKEFIIALTEQDFFNRLGYALPKRCPECRKATDNVETITCKECGKEFTITESEKSFYKRNGLFVPHRCPECRKARKERLDKLKEKNKE